MTIGSFIPSYDRGGTVKGIHCVGAASFRESAMMTPEIIARLKKRVTEFDVFALLDLLEFLGMDVNQITFKGYRGNESQPGMIRSIDFQRNGQIAVEFFYGILGANSPLPSYFFRMADTGEVNELHFNEFFGFIDQALIKTWLKTMYPERFNLSYMFRENRRNWLGAFSKLGSIQQIKWLFDLVFPELQVRVHRKQFGNTQEARPAVIGRSKIGIEMILGHHFPTMDYRYSINLISYDEIFRKEVPWRSEIEDRIHSRIFPLLSPLSMNLEIVLTILESKSWMTLSQETGFLGYERLKNENTRMKQIPIHLGLIPT
jgi:hypothetical protein